MNGAMNFLFDPKVHDTVLVTMVITSLLAAIRRFKTIDNTPIAPGAWAFLKLVWNFAYDWALGFWSMKTGQPIHPLEIHTSSSEPTPDGPKIEEQTIGSNGPGPLVTPVDPAQPK